MVEANTATGFTKAHLAYRMKYEKDFFECLKQDLALRILSGLNPASGERIFYEQTRGAKTNMKQQILNNSLKYYTLTHLRRND